jgi:hypothetical protein
MASTMLINKRATVNAGLSASSTLGPQSNRTWESFNLSRLYNRFEHLILTRLFSRNACLALAIVPVLNLLSVVPPFPFRPSVVCKFSLSKLS